MGVENGWMDFSLNCYLILHLSVVRLSHYQGLFVCMSFYIDHLLVFCYETIFLPLSWLSFSIFPTGVSEASRQQLQLGGGKLVTSKLGDQLAVEPTAGGQRVKGGKIGG